MGIESIMDPEAVAVVGASKNQTKRGFQAIRTLMLDGFEGKVYPVNPKEKSILGLPCYPRVSDIPGPVDLALITTPAATLPSVLDDCGKKGVAGAVVIAGGFGEAGRAGKDLEKELVEAARRNSIRLIGPNTSGMMNLKSNLNLVGLRDTPRGEIALLTQSGNMALALITEARIKSQGFIETDAVPAKQPDHQQAVDIAVGQEDFGAIGKNGRVRVRTPGHVHGI